MVQRLQELLDSHEAMQEIALRLSIQIRKVEAGAEMAPLAPQHEQPRVSARGLRDGSEQRLGHPLVEGVGFVRSVKDKLGHRARLPDQNRIGR